MRLLTYRTPTDSQPGGRKRRCFGQGNSGHAGRITSIAWCAVPGYANVIGSAATDKCVLIWNLESSVEEEEEEKDQGWDSEEDTINPPTPTLIGPFKSTPMSISFHPSTSSRLMVYDANGSIKLIDWTKPGRPIVMCLIEPRTLVNQLNCLRPVGGDGMGMADWKADEADVFGALNGNRWAVWDMRSTRAGTPLATGEVWGGSVSADVLR